MEEEPRNQNAQDAKTERGRGGKAEHNGITPPPNQRQRHKKTKSRDVKSTRQSRHGKATLRMRPKESKPKEAGAD